MQPTLPAKAPAPPAPRFYLTTHQPLGTGAILLAILIAFGTISAILYALGHTGHASLTAGGPGSAGSTSTTAAQDAEDKDDPSQIDTIVLGDPADAPVPGRRGDHVSSVHPTILVRLPRFGDELGLIPDTPAGQSLYRWLAAFNQKDDRALASALPNEASASSVAAQIELRQQTGGFALLSAKEVQPGVLVFRLRDQTPAATEALGTLQVQPNSSPPIVMTFSLSAVPSSRQNSAPLSTGSSR